MSDWNKAKNAFLKMTVNEKREFYKCGENFRTISDIPDWSTTAKIDDSKLDGSSATVKDYSEKEAMKMDSETDEAKRDVSPATVERSSVKVVLNEDVKTDDSKLDGLSATIEVSSEKDALSMDTETNEAKVNVPHTTVEVSSEKVVLSEDIKTDEAKLNASEIVVVSSEKEALNMDTETDEARLNVSSVEEDASNEETKTDKTKAKLDVSSVTESDFPKNDALNKKISLFTGDITCLEIDAIVNAANDALLCGGGVDAAIHSAAGRSLLEDECWSLDGCDTGDAKITGGYKLPAKYVIHAVGPRGENPNLLSSCYKKAMDLLKEHKLETIAFPCISTGIYGYPNKNAAGVALETIRKWLDEDDYSSNVKRVIFCLFLDVDIQTYHKLMPKYFPL